MIDWDSIYIELKDRCRHAKALLPKLNGFYLDVQMHNYPPRICVDIAIPSEDSRRNEVHLGNDVFVYEKYTDEELKEITNIAMSFYGIYLNSEGLKIYRDRRPQRGVVRFSIKPESYEEWI